MLTPSCWDKICFSHGGVLPPHGAFTPHGGKSACTLGANSFDILPMLMLGTGGGGNTQNFGFQVLGRYRNCVFSYVKHVLF